jgi:hypothetical protein
MAGEIPRIQFLSLIARRACSVAVWVNALRKNAKYNLILELA